MEGTNLTPESRELINILDGINALNIYAIRFYPATSVSFNVMTTNMKKIALAIIGKNNRTKFQPNELRDIFERIKAHLPDNIGPEKRKIIEDTVERFVAEGGNVEVITRTSRTKREILIFISFFIVLLGAFGIVCGGGSFLWIKSKLLFFILLVVYFAYLYFHSIVTKKMENKLKEETIDLLPDTSWLATLRNIGDFTGSFFFVSVFYGMLGFFVSLFNPFK